MILQKLETHLKDTLGMRQEEVNRITKLTAVEIEQLREQEKELESEIKRQQEELAPEQFNLESLNLKQELSSEVEVIQNLNNQLQDDATQNSRKVPAEAREDSNAEALVYICNVYLKYLETLYQPPNSGKKQEQIQSELRTIEQLLLTQLKASFEQTKRIEQMI